MSKNRNRESAPAPAAPAPEAQAAGAASAPVEAGVVHAIPPEMLPGSAAAEKEGSVSAVVAAVEPRAPEITSEVAAESSSAPEQTATAPAETDQAIPPMPPHWATATRKAIKVDMPDGKRYGFRTMKQAQQFIKRRGGEVKLIDVDEAGYSIADEVAYPRRHRLV